MVTGFSSGDKISIISKSPLWASAYNELPNEIENYNNYSHTIKALGGYWDANISMSLSKAQAEDWFSGGIGRDITIYNPAGVVIWNGFANQVTVQMGAIQATRGPLTDVSNKVKVVYSTIDASTAPPILGVRSDTAYASDTTSQGKYGIIERILSTGGSTPTNAEQIRDRFLEENKEPDNTENITIGNTQNPTVTLQLLGYVHWLNLYTYSSTTTGTRAYNTRIQDVLGADPNSIFSTDYSQISSNALTVSRYDNDDRKGWQIIKGIVAHGDSSDNRWVFGIYGGNRKAYYYQAPSEIEYVHKITDRKQRIDDREGGNEILPWDVMPAKWLQVSDFLIGSRLLSSDLRRDPRSVFIESVTYTAPYSLQVNGIKLETLPQMLSKMGLSGIGA